MIKKRHITEFLDDLDFMNLSDVQKNEIDAHIPNCAECRRAYQSAEIGAFLLGENAALPTTVPSPFFQSKVLNLWREKQIAKKPIAVLHRWWQASATLVLLMFLTVIGLIAATLIGSHSDFAAKQNDDTKVTLYSTETVILNQGKERNLTLEQVFDILDDNE